MNTLTTILLAINAADLIILPFYGVWIIRKGIWQYDLGMIHRAFHIVQLLILTTIAVFTYSATGFGVVVFAVYVATCLQYNFALHQFLTPNAVFGECFPYKGPWALSYFSMLRNDFDVFRWIYRDITTLGVFVDPQDIDIVCMHSGRSWGFVKYLSNYGLRLACDLFGIILILIFLA
jgi:hypothetical protein